MNDSTRRTTHEVYVNPNAKRVQKIVGAAVVLLLILGGVGVFTYMNSRSQQPAQQDPAPQEPPPPLRTYWYSDAPILEKTFGDFLGSTQEDTNAAAALFLSGTLWKDRLDPAADHEEIRPYAGKLVTQTVLLVASDTPLDAKLSDVFAGIIAKPENKSLLVP